MSFSEQNHVKRQKPKFSQCQLNFAILSVLEQNMHNINTLRTKKQLVQIKQGYFRKLYENREFQFLYQTIQFLSLNKYKIFKEITDIINLENPNINVDSITIKNQFDIKLSSYQNKIPDNIYCKFQDILINTMKNNGEIQVGLVSQLINEYAKERKLFNEYGISTVDTRTAYSRIQYMIKCIKKDFYDVDKQKESNILDQKQENADSPSQDANANIQSCIIPDQILYISQQCSQTIQPKQFEDIITPPNTAQNDDIMSSNLNIVASNPKQRPSNPKQGACHKVKSLINTDIQQLKKEKQTRNEKSACSKQNSQHTSQADNQLACKEMDQMLQKLKMILNM